MNGITKMGRALTQMLLPVVLAVAPILAHAEEVGTESSKPNPLTEFQPGLLIWTWITFLLLLAVLTWKAWPPITKALKARISGQKKLPSAPQNWPLRWSRSRPVLLLPCGLFSNKMAC